MWERPSFYSLWKTLERDLLAQEVLDLADVLLSPEIQPTIIDAKAFHCPVRNGKEWYHLAMVARQNFEFCAESK